MSKNEIIFLIGVVIADGGISVIYWPAALILTGLGIAFLAIKLELNATKGKS